MPLLQKRETQLQRLRRLLAKTEGDLRRRFEQALEGIRGAATLRVLADLIEAGSLDAAAVVAEDAFLIFASGWEQSFVASARGVSVELTNRLHRFVDFDQTNVGAVRAMRDARLRHARLTEDTRLVVRRTLVDGVRRGLNPIDVAREVRASIGLTPTQEGWVRNYRRMLEGDVRDRREALTRQLRDRRFDRSVRADRPLSKREVDRMVQRYRERAIKYRSEVIARTEALRATHLGNHAAYRQAVDDGVLDEQRLERKWVIARVPGWRESHRLMGGQKRSGLDQPFTSGNGNSLRYPGDERAPGSETIQCRCVVTTRLLPPSDDEGLL